MAEEIGFENGRNSNFEGLVTLTLTLDPAIRHTVVHHSSTSTYIPNFIEIEETFCGRTDGRTFFPPLILLGRLSEVDLKIKLNNDKMNQLPCEFFRSLSVCPPMSFPFHSSVSPTLRAALSDHRTSCSEALHQQLAHIIQLHIFSCFTGLMTELPDNRIKGHSV